MGTITSTRGSGWTPKVHDRNRPHPKGLFRLYAQWRRGGRSRRILRASLLKALVVDHGQGFQEGITVEQAPRVIGGPLLDTSAPPFLVPCMTENAHSLITELGLACAKHIVGSEILCENKKMASVEHCQKLVQFMWWAAKPDDTTMAYRVALTLIADPKPSMVRWRDIAIEEGLGRATTAKLNESSNTKPLPRRASRMPWWAPWDLSRRPWSPSN